MDRAAKIAVLLRVENERMKILPIAELLDDAIRKWFGRMDAQNPTRTLAQSLDRIKIGEELPHSVDINFGFRHRSYKLDFRRIAGQAMQQDCLRPCKPCPCRRRPAQLLRNAVVRDSLADHQGQILRGRNGQVNESRGVGTTDK
jgi:hypothetical protein